MKVVTIFVALLATATIGAAYGPCISDELLPGPNSTQSWQSWFNGLHAFKTSMLRQINFTSTWYHDSRLKWAATAFIQPQMMVHERYFYDPIKGEYTVDRYLDDLLERYGGIDAVLIWHPYPNIGIDDRNQFDVLRSMPGFPHKVRQMIDDFHRRGVRVLFPYTPWDQGTRPEMESDPTTIAHLWKEINADGFNGDTMSEIPREFFDASVAVNHPLLLQSEDLDHVAPSLSWQLSGWGYWGPYCYSPCVSALKWLEPAHISNVCNRWGQDHTDDLQYAFFNGAGFETWENVWGYWNQVIPRDAIAIRRIATILRHFGPTLLLSSDWVPHLPSLHHNITFISQWRDNTTTERLWLIVNRTPSNATGAQLLIPATNATLFFNIWSGEQIKSTTIGSNVVLSFLVEARGYSAIYATDRPLTPAFKAFLSTMNKIGKRLLASYSTEWIVLNQTMTPVGRTQSPTVAPPGTVLIPSNRAYQFSVSGNEIEGSNRIGVDVQFPWDPYPQRHHSAILNLTSFYIDIYPITNADYLTYLKVSNYFPADGGQNFLRHWSRHPTWKFPNGWDRKPVTWISIEDAREYCAFYGKRLPASWEWQYAAQGTDLRSYPWGNSWENGTHVPAVCTDRTMRPPDDVDAHPSGASPFGVMDLVGNVYQWTNEFTDAHTRSAIIRGGNYYQPQGSRWYLPQSYSLQLHTKLLLMAPSMDRSGGIGFRCVADA